MTLSTVGLVLAILPFTLAVYGAAFTASTKKAHQRLLIEWLDAIRGMRTLALATEDARRVLGWINWVYGTPTKLSLLSRDMWLWRCGLISVAIATAYVILPMAYIIVVDLRSSDFELGVFFLIGSFVLINAGLDTVSINVSRLLFARMAQASGLRQLAVLAIVDLAVGLLLYLTGPGWVGMTVVVTDSSNPGSRLDQTLDFILPWRMFSAAPSLVVLFGVMFITTIVPTAIHLIVTSVFFGSKVLAQPLRLAVETVLGYLVKLEQGVAVGLAVIFSAVLVIAVVWVV